MLYPGYEASLHSEQSIAFLGAKHSFAPREAHHQGGCDFALKAENVKNNESLTTSDWRISRFCRSSNDIFMHFNAFIHRKA